jgi:Kef-type K+ transport system membrane component KefB
MRKVLLYSLLLVAGLIGSQFMGGAPAAVKTAISLATMLALSFIMIHVGYEFEMDKSRPGQYAWDYLVAASAATLPWIFCTLYFVFAMSSPEMRQSVDLWRSALLEGLFAAPTSAGVLFSMLAAAGLGATWLFKKARVLAIFDDLQTILLLVPLKVMIIGPKWQLFVVAGIIVALLYVAYRYLNTANLPVTWPWVISYAAVIVAGSELLHWLSVKVDPSVPIHLEVLLPAFALGCIMKPPPGHNPHIDDAIEGTEEGPEQPNEQFVSTIVSAIFMVLVGLSMPPIIGQAPADAHGTSSGFAFAGVAPEVLEAHHHFPGWGVIAVHVLAITILSNLGKMAPALCYRKDASWRERLALAIGMFPRGEVGAGVLVVALSYQLNGPTLTVAVLSLALNLLCTGVFIIAVKKLLGVGAHAVQIPS